MSELKHLKYQLRVGDRNTVVFNGQLSSETIRLGPGESPGFILLWALVNLAEKPESRTFHIFGTGHEIQLGLKFLDTVQCHGYVWHVYVEPRP